jgi:hypothetical protein
VDDSALSSENKAQREMKISATKRQRMLDYCSSGDARWSPALSISAPIFFETLGAWPVVCCCTGAPVASGATVLVSGRVAAGDRVTLCGVGFSCCGAVGLPVGNGRTREKCGGDQCFHHDCAPGRWLSSFLAYGIRHSGAALPKRLFMASRGVLRSLMLDLGIKFRAYENDNR